MLNDLPASGQHSLPPDPKGTAGVFRRVGYDLEDALADIIDNSVDASATSILVRLVRSKNSVVRIVVADNGCGMTEKKLDEIMQYGVQGTHKKGDLGKYGIGLKSASFSQCASLSVVSRRDKRTSGRRWTLTSIAKDWTVEEIDHKAAARFYDQDWSMVLNDEAGTMVIWDDLELSMPSGKDFEKSLSALLKGLSVGLGLRFHRFIQQEQFAIHLDVQNASSGHLGLGMPVLPLDPFGYSRTGRKGFPTDFIVDIEGLGDLTLHAHIWPAKSKDSNYKLGGGNVAGRQGFYFYRNGRLIQAGGWNKVQKSDHEPHLSLARVSIDLPPAFDSAFKLTIQKSAVEPPRAFLDALRDAYSGTMSFSQYLSIADETYRTARPDKSYTYLYPGNGIPSVARRHIKKYMRSVWEGEGVPVDFRWASLDEDTVFAIDREHKAITLNRLYRRAMTGDSKGKTDAPLIKLLLFYLLENTLMKDRHSKAQQERIDQLNAALLEVLQ